MERGHLGRIMAGETPALRVLLEILRTNLKDHEGCFMKSIYPWAALLFVILFATASSAAANADGRNAEVWIDVYEGEPVSYESVLADLAEADVIYLGEYHTIARHHQIQERILTDLGQKVTPLAVGLEQIEAWRQPELDRYNRGEIDFDELAKAIDWAKSWSNYEQYRGVLEAARKLKAPVVGLNAKAEIIRQVARSGGVEKLPAEARKELPAEMQLQDPLYEKALSLELGVHAKAMPNMLRPMIEAQMARDESMAESIAAFKKSMEGQGRKMIVLCGAGHVARGQGTAARVRRRMPGVKDRIVVLAECGEQKLSPAEQAMASEAQITHEQLRELNQPIADYLCVKPIAEEIPEPPRNTLKVPSAIDRAMLWQKYKFLEFNQRETEEELEKQKTERLRELDALLESDWSPYPHPENMPYVQPSWEYPLKPQGR